MRTSSVVLVLTAAAIASTAGVFAQSRARSRTIGVDEVRPGMRGYGLSVFHGSIPERFEVEVVDVLHEARPGMDMVLVRTSHPLLDTAGTVAGMSGSPVYLDGDRLLGAYAYGWEFGREPVAGVTPIGNMVAELHRPRRTPAGLIPGSRVPLPIAGSASTRGTAWQEVFDHAIVSRTPLDTSHGSLLPMSVPLAVAGMADGAFRALATAFEPMGILPVQAGGTGRLASPAPAGSSTHFVPGGAVAIALITGDIAASATGTVTYVDGDQVVAFGHPMLGLGETALPAALAHVAWINAGYRRSFKMAEPLGTLGALIEDRPFTIVLDEHAVAPTLPMHVHVNAPMSTAAARTDWNVQIAYQRSLVSRLYASVLGSVLETAAGDAGDAAWVIRSTVSTRDHGALTVEDVGVSTDGTTSLQAASLRLTEIVERLTDNPFEQVRMDRIDVNVDVRWAREFYYVRSLAASRAEVDPGDTVQLTVSLGRYGEAPVTRVVPITFPRDVAGRDVEIEVGAGIDTLPELAEPESIGDLLHNLAGSFPEDALVVSMRMPGQGVMVRGRVVPNLPGSALDALRPAASTDSGEPFLNVRRTVLPVGRLVVGRDRVRVHVREVRQ